MMKKGHTVLSSMFCWIMAMSLTGLLLQQAENAIPGKQLKYSVKKESPAGSIILEEQEDENQTPKTKIKVSDSSRTEFDLKRNYPSANRYLIFAHFAPCFPNPIYLRNRNFRI